jgi:hypothetical protein
LTSARAAILSQQTDPLRVEPEETLGHSADLGGWFEVDLLCDAWLSHFGLIIKIAVPALGS